MALSETVQKSFSEICSFGGVKLNILVDYLTVSVKQMELDTVLKILKLDKKNMVQGYSRWLGQKYYQGGISVHYGDYIILEMSGSGCRFLESLYEKKLNWIDFIEQFLCLEGSHLARLDIACDDYPQDGEPPLLSFKTLFRHVQQDRYVSLAHYCTWHDGSEQAIYWGSPKSDRRLRIYNKALERGAEGHWIRAEFQLRNECALSYYMRALECGSIGKAYQGMLYDFLRFTREVNRPGNTNQARLHVTRWWQTFCGNAKKIKGFYVGGLEYNLEKLDHYLYKNAGSSMKTFLACNGGDVGKLMEFAEKSDYNEKQKFLVKAQPLIDKMKQDYDKEAAENSAAILEMLENPKWSRMDRTAMISAERDHRKAEAVQDYYEHYGLSAYGFQKYWDEKQLEQEDLPFD